MRRVPHPPPNASRVSLLRANRTLRAPPVKAGLFRTRQVRQRAKTVGQAIIVQNGLKPRRHVLEEHGQIRPMLKVSTRVWTVQQAIIARLARCRRFHAPLVHIRILPGATSASQHPLASISSTRAKTLAILVQRDTTACQAAYCLHPAQQERSRMKLGFGMKRDARHARWATSAYKEVRSQLLAPRIHMGVDVPT